MRINPHSTEARRRADLEEADVRFTPWDPGQTYPTSSLPALRASKCAQLQGEAAFQRFHIALFRAFFEESRNIGDREVLVSLAKEASLDVDRFSLDFDRGSQESAVLAEYEDGQTEYSGWGIPLAIVEDLFPIGGAVPTDVYRRAIDRCLAKPAG